MYKFDAKKVKDELVQWMRDWESKNAKDCNFVLGISGGKDSTIVAALLKECFGPERVYGVMIPCGEQKDIDVSRRVIETLGINSMEVNIKDAVSAVVRGIECKVYDKSQKESGILTISNQTQTNIPPRVRMTVLYAISQSLNGRVIGTCNLSENYIGYLTIHGDGASDCEPLANLTVQEVKAIGYELGIPGEFIEKIPDDGLPCSTSDEQKFGFTYKVLDRYIRTGEIEDLAIKEKIDGMHKRNLFKLQPIATFDPKL